MHIRRSSSVITTFSAQSLTDIVFLLLIFFLLSSTFILQTGVKVQLPKTTVGEPLSERMLVISIRSDGSVYLNASLAPLSRAELAARIRQRLTDRDQVVILRADKNLQLDAMVKVMDIAKSAGASRFLIATQTE